MRELVLPYPFFADLERGYVFRESATETAQALWGLLLPHGLQGGALSHIRPTGDEDGGTRPAAKGERGWQKNYTDWWFEFLTEKGGKGISKDTWVMVSALSPSL